MCLCHTSSLFTYSTSYRQIKSLANPWIRRCLVRATLTNKWRGLCEQTACGLCGTKRQIFGRPLGPAYQINRDCTFLCNTNTYHHLHHPQLHVLVTMPKGTRGLAFTARRWRQLCGSEGGGSLAAASAVAAWQRSNCGNSVVPAAAQTRW